MVYIHEGRTFFLKFVKTSVLLRLLFCPWSAIVRFYTDNSVQSTNVFLINFYLRS